MISHAIILVLLHCNHCNFTIDVCTAHIKNGPHSCTDREAILQLDAKLKEERKQAGEKVFFLQLRESLRLVASILVSNYG